MARYMSMQYPYKNPGHQHNGKRGIETERRGDPISGNKVNNATGIVGAHVRDVTIPENSTVWV